LNTCTVSN